MFIAVTAQLFHEQDSPYQGKALNISLFLEIRASGLLPIIL